MKFKQEHIKVSEIAENCITHIKYHKDQCKDGNYTARCDLYYETVHLIENELGLKGNNFLENKEYMEELVDHYLNDGLTNIEFISILINIYCSYNM